MKAIIKVSPLCIKSFKQHKNKKGLIRFLKVKISENYDSQFELSKQNYGKISEWVTKKIDVTSSFGAMRLIYSKKLQSNGESKVVCDFYFKNDKSDLNKQDENNIAVFLSQCNNQEYFESLQDIDEID